MKSATVVEEMNGRNYRFSFGLRRRHAMIVYVETCDTENQQVQKKWKALTITCRSDILPSEEKHKQTSVLRQLVVERLGFVTEEVCGE